MHYTHNVGRLTAVGVIAIHAWRLGAVSVRPLVLTLALLASQGLLLCAALALERGVIAYQRERQLLSHHLARRPVKFLNKRPKAISL